MMIFGMLCKRKRKIMRLNTSNRNTMKRLFSLLPLILLLITSCKKDGCNQKMAFNYDPVGNSEENCVWEPIEVRLEFNPVFGNQAFKENQEFTVNGRALTMDFYGIYFTEISLKLDEKDILLGNENEACVVTETSDAILFKDDNRVFESSFLPNADVALTGLSFNLGVDICRNNGLDPTTQTSGPFMPHNPTMYWSWASGYRFVSFNGTVDVSPNADGSDIRNFEYHTGLNSLLREVYIDLNSKELDANDLIIRVNVDFEKIFAEVDFTTELSTHTFDNVPLAEKITENTVNAITVE